MSYRDEQDVADVEPSRDWRRVERCVWFGVRRWAMTAAAVMWAVQNLDEWWIRIPVVCAIGAVHVIVAERIDARLEAAGARPIAVPPR